jgi:hypothetical protein
MLKRKMRYLQAIILILSFALCLRANENEQKPLDIFDQTQNLKKIFLNIKKSNTEPILNEEIQTLTEKSTFTEEELLSLCNTAIKKLDTLNDNVANENYVQLETITKVLIQQLKDFKISGVGFAAHVSAGFFGSSQNFDVNFAFKNSLGDTFGKEFNLKYYSFGWQNELIYRFDTIFVINTDISRYEALNPIKLGKGFCAGWRLPYASFQEDEVREGILYRKPSSVIGMTIIPITSQGCLVIAHFGLGFTGWSACQTYGSNAFNLALVSRGKLQSKALSQNDDPSTFFNYNHTSSENGPSRKNETKTTLRF